MGGGEVTPIVFYPWLTEPLTQHQFSDQALEALLTDPETGESILDPNPDGGDIMPDSIRIKEIHAALEADRYGVHPEDPEKQQRNNIGRLTEAVAYVLGVALNSDGENIPYPDPEHFSPGALDEVKHLKMSQWAAFDGAKGMQAACLYDVRSTVASTDTYGRTLLQKGGGVKAWNLAQLLDQVSDDIELSLNSSALASLQVPAVDGKTYYTYSGLGHAIQDILYMLSSESKRVDELVIQNARLVHLSQQILFSLGLPLHVDTLEMQVGAETASANNPPKMGYAIVPTVDANAPTLTSFFGLVLANLSRLVAGTIDYQGSNVSAKSPDDPFNFEEPVPGAQDI